ncbi:MAG TPA: tRNA-dihydrouridine synthase family protein [Myxococcota bacterium]|nr:tRNA-dihydrouridine synthase family protein [Myxococcota bacterium]HQK49638.1 tRNA-dihydrouridine synthase family protein [Myxococcota bacterium]
MLDLGALLATHPFVAAPLDGYSDWPFRLLCRSQGAALCFSEMVPAMALVRGAEDARRRLDIPPEDHPLVVQVEGADPATMAEAAVQAQEAGADAVDINAGCPSRRVTNGRAGAALLSDLPRLEAIVKSVRQAVRVPVTLKIRTGAVPGHSVLEEVAAMAADHGLTLVTLHARTRSQGFRGNADWSQITRLRGILPCPLIGNGDILSAEDGLRMLRQTGCHGAMVGRASIGNPWIFRELLALWRGLPVPPRPDRQEWRSVVTRHFDLLCEAHQGDDRMAARLFRKHLSRYSRGMAGAVALRRFLPQVQSRSSLLGAIETLLQQEQAGPPGPVSPEGDLPWDTP